MKIPPGAAYFSWYVMYDSRKTGQWLTCAPRLPALKPCPMSDDVHPATANGGQAPSSATNRSLLRNAAAGSPEAWDRLVTLYAPLVLGWCRRGALQTADTADIVQEVFLAVATHVSGFRKQ